MLKTLLKVIVLMSVLIGISVFAVWFIVDKYQEYDRETVGEIQDTLKSFINSTTYLGTSGDLTVENFLMKDIYHMDKRITACREIDECLETPMDCDELYNINEFFEYNYSMIVSQLDTMKISSIKVHESCSTATVKFDVTINIFMANRKGSDAGSDFELDYKQSSTPYEIVGLEASMVKVDDEWKVKYTQKLQRGLRQFSSLWDGTGENGLHNIELLLVPMDETLKGSIQ